MMIIFSYMICFIMFLSYICKQEVIILQNNYLCITLIYNETYNIKK